MLENEKIELKLAKMQEKIIVKIESNDLLYDEKNDCYELDNSNFKNLTEFLDKKNQETKISSKEDVQVLFLKKNPKIISLVKEWNPKIHLIGFKLLVDVSQEHLIQIAQESLEKNQADLIVANDLTQISSEQHKAYLVEKNSFQTAMSKHEIADLLLEKIKRYD